MVKQKRVYGADVDELIFGSDQQVTPSQR